MAQGSCVASVKGSGDEFSSNALKLFEAKRSRPGCGERAANQRLKAADGAGAHYGYERVKGQGCRGYRQGSLKSKRSLCNRKLLCFPLYFSFVLFDS